MTTMREMVSGDKITIHPGLFPVEAKVEDLNNGNWKLEVDEGINGRIAVVVPRDTDPATAASELEERYRMVRQLGAKSTHQQFVEQLMLVSGRQIVRTVPAVQGSPEPIVSDSERLLAANLLFEECMETIAALGVGLSVSDPTPANGRLTVQRTWISIDGQMDLVEVVDGVFDVRVVATRILSVVGMPDMIGQMMVDRNNLEKFGPGHHYREDGKLVKPPGHKPPDITNLIAVTLERSIPVDRPDDL